MRSSHLKEKPYGCHCGASYTVRQSLLRHQAQHGMDTGLPGEHGQRDEEVYGGEEAPPLRSHHSKPIRGRPRKSTLLREERGEVQRGRRREGVEETDKRAEVSGDMQHAVVYVHTDDLSAPASTSLLIAADGSSLPAGAEPELVEVVISGGAEQCIVVQGREAVGDLLILQEEEGGNLCSVAQTVEINSA